MCMTCVLGLDNAWAFSWFVGVGDPLLWRVTPFLTCTHSEIGFLFSKHSSTCNSFTLNGLSPQFLPSILRFPYPLNQIFGKQTEWCSSDPERSVLILLLGSPPKIESYCHPPDGGQVACESCPLLSASVSVLRVCGVDTRVETVILFVWTFLYKQMQIQIVGENPATCVRQACILSLVRFMFCVRPQSVCVLSSLHSFANVWWLHVTYGKCTPISQRLIQAWFVGGHI